MRFVVTAGASSLALFALLRAPLVDHWITLPLTRLQKQVADQWSGVPMVPVNVTADCSGTDVLALCLAAILAAPFGLRARIAGAVGALALVLGLNTVRIASLGHAAGSPRLFDALHLQVWPAILVLAAAGYVFGWMWLARTRERGVERGSLGGLTGHFAGLAAVLLVLFALSGPWIARSELLLTAGGWTAGAAAFVLTALGQAAVASGNVLSTTRGAFQVTPDCLATALFPLAVAAVLALPLPWRWRAVALLALPPLSLGLAVVRLLALALPPVLVASPLFLVHGFHQFVLAALCVLGLALSLERPTPGRWTRGFAHASVALGAAVLVAALAGASLGRAVEAAASALAMFVPQTLTALSAPGDAQGALALLPAFQSGLLVALAVVSAAGWRRFAWAFGALVVSQLLLLVLVGASSHAGLVPHAALLRAWAVMVPLLLTLLLFRQPQHAGAPPRAADTRAH